jgi:hypothetical protein
MRRATRFAWGLLCMLLLLPAGCSLFSADSLDAPGQPWGVTVGVVSESILFSVADVACPGGHSVVYQWDWGNGSSSDWLEGNSAAHAWAIPGDYTVKCRAQCRDDAAATSPWSQALDVSIMPLPTPTS